MRWVVTGANRGIGLEIVRQLAARGDFVEATARDVGTALELRALAEGAEGRVRLHACELSDEAGVRKLASDLGDVSVDVLVNNAGVLGKMQSLEDVDLEDAMRTFDVNALGPIRTTRALLPALERGKTRKIAHISSGMGSISDNTSGGAYAYRMAKAALNMANKSMSVDLRARGFICVVVNPGWVQTDMGGHGAPTPVEESVRRILARLDGLRASDTGTFVDYKGGTLEY